MQKTGLSTIFIAIIGILVNSTLLSAQTNTIVSVQSETTSVSTGEYYTLSIHLQEAIEVWQINTEIEYDPQSVYVVGTISGSPLTSGDYFSGEPAIVIRNEVVPGQITYTHSLIAPANPKTGSGLVATFQIYPLSAGTTQIRFSSADLTKVNFVQGGDGTRDVASTEALPVIPAAIELVITGETVPPPDESTPTPSPTSTPDIIGRGVAGTAEPTLVNVTLEPGAFPTLIPAIDNNEAQSVPILPIAMGLLIFGGIGVVILVTLTRRR